MWTDSDIYFSFLVDNHIRSQWLSVKESELIPKGLHIQQHGEKHILYTPLHLECNPFLWKIVTDGWQQGVMMELCDYKVTFSNL